jgi:hypothetical protein
MKVTSFGGQRDEPQAPRRAHGAAQEDGRSLWSLDALSVNHAFMLHHFGEWKNENLLFRRLERHPSTLAMEILCDLLFAQSDTPSIPDYRAITYFETNFDL